MTTKSTTKIESLPRKDLQSYLDQEDMGKLHKLKLHYDNLYYNTGEDVLDDWRYDMLKETLMARDPDYVPPVGAKLRDGENRATLPFWLGSADKYTPEEEDGLQRWQTSNEAKEYTVSDKLDGVSCLLVCRNGRVKLFTRGDGVIGADISYLAGYFNIPDLTGKTVSVRGELIMTKKDFAPYHRKSGAERKVLESGSKNYRNARSMVAGMIGAKTARHGLNKIHFVAYEMVGNETMPKPSRALRNLKKMGFEVVTYTKTHDISVQGLSDMYISFKEASKYEIDGIIIQSDLPYDRNTTGNPSYMFAFKMLQNDNIHTTTVLGVEWNVSKWGQLKPVVLVEPVRLADVTIGRASAHNGKYIIDNGIGTGAIIQVTRSKDVIPYIVSIVNKVEPELPNVEWKWDKNNINMLTVEFNDMMSIKLIAGFFAKMGIKHVSQATVERMYKNGLNTLIKIVAASKKRLAKVPRFKEGLVNRTWDNIHNGLQGVKISTVVGSAGVFGNGIGRKRMDALLLDIPDLFTVYKTISPATLKRKILAVEGFSDIMADKIISNIKLADRFIKRLSKYATFNEEVRVSNTLTGKKFVMSGFRDKELENNITERGGKTVGSVSKNTSGLIVPSKGGKATGKILKAQNLKIPIYGKQEFIEKFIR